MLRLKGSWIKLGIVVSMTVFPDLALSGDSDLCSPSIESSKDAKPIEAEKLVRESTDATLIEAEKLVGEAVELYRQGRHAEAQEIDERVSELLYLKFNASSGARLARSLNNQAYMYWKMGDYARAEPLYRESLEIREKVLGPKHPDTVQSLNNLAVLYGDMGAYDKAEPLLMLSLNISEEVLGPEHPQTATSLNNLAQMYWEMGDYAKAEPLYMRSWKINEKVLGPEHPDTVTSQNNLALLYHGMGAYDRAEPLLTRSLKISEKVNGPEHPYTALYLNNLAFLHGETNRSRESLALFLRSFKGLDRLIANVSGIATESQLLRFVELSSGGYEGLVSLVHRKLSHDTKAVRQCLNTILKRKGITLDVWSRKHRAMVETRDGKQAEEWSRLAAARAELRNLYILKPDSMSYKDFTARKDDLEREVDRLESSLAAVNEMLSEEISQRHVDVAKVRDQLSPGSVLVEYVKARDYDWEKGKWSKTYRYLGFVLHPDGKIDMVDFGESDALDEKIQESLAGLQRQISSREDLKIQLEAARQLYKPLWKPLLPFLGDAETVIVSPDGELNFVPFAAIRNDEGKFLVESVSFIYVTSGRDLLRGKGTSGHESDLFLAANPEFELTVQARAPSNSPSGGTGKVRSRDFKGNFTPLPGTDREATVIPPLLQGSVKKVVTGEAATEQAVLQSSKPKIMHLATHGYFLPAQKLPEDRDGGVRAISNQSQYKHTGYENPLVRSGLAFAGANHAGKAETGLDGLLTALEVTGMNLHGTDLVTLSACETGVGEAKSGEGVFGLRRSFVLAGARNLLMSLWPVSDDVTAEQMEQFYRHYGEGMRPAEALHKAQLATIATLRRQYGSAPPMLWAPFIVQGQP